MPGVLSRLELARMVCDGHVRVTSVILLLNQAALLTSVHGLPRRKDLPDARRAVLGRTEDIDAHVVRAARSLKRLSVVEMDNSSDLTGSTRGP
jgi:hypothetical protein